MIEPEEPEEEDGTNLQKDIGYCTFCGKEPGERAIHFIESNIIVCEECQILAEGER